MNVTFVKRGHITIGEQSQGKNGFYYSLGASVVFQLLFQQIFK